MLTVVRDGTSPLTIRLLAAHSLDTIGAPLSADDQALLSKLEGELHRQNTPAPYVGNQL